MNRDELLEHHEIKLDNLEKKVYSNVIVITNEAERENNFNLLETRVQNRNLDHEFSLEQRLGIYKPKLEKFISDNFKKSIDKLESDFNNPLKAMKLIGRAAKILNKDKSEEALIKLLQDYHFIGPNITNLEQLEIYFLSLVKKNFNLLVNEETTFHFYDSIENIKNLYTNVVYKKLLKSKRIIAQYLDSKDNFQERLNMLDLLYEAKIIENVNQEAFFECTNCDQNVFKGTMYLKIRPNKLAKFKCPACEKEVFYLAPYKLNDEMYKLIIQTDGIIVNLLEQILNEKKLECERNIPVSIEIEGKICNSEIDVAVKENGKYKYVFETKMLHANNDNRRHQSKIHSALKETYSLKKILEAKGEVDSNTIYFIILNINDTALISDAEQSFIMDGADGSIKVISIEDFKTSFQLIS